MDVIFVNDYSKKYLDKESVVAIGNFDGVHLGHQMILNELNNYQLNRVIITFNPHPSAFFRKDEYLYLTPLKAKIELFKPYCDTLLVLDFNNTLANMSKEGFVNFLKLNNITNVICGHDFTFGINKEGTPNILSKYFNTKVFNPYLIDNERVSSSIIKQLLEHKRISLVNNYLGRIYSIKGTVIRGKAIGRTIGFKTANLDTNDYYIPSNGVYIVKVKYNEKFYNGMLNIGFNPTFNMDAKRSIEVHILDFDKEIYDETLEVFFYEFLRDEKKFSNINMLINELEKNKEEIRKYFTKNT